MAGILQTNGTCQLHSFHCAAHYVNTYIRQKNGIVSGRPNRAQAKVPLSWHSLRSRSGELYRRDSPLGTCRVFTAGRSPLSTLIQFCRRVRGHPSTQRAPASDSAAYACIGRKPVARIGNGVGGRRALRQSRSLHARDCRHPANNVTIPVKLLHVLATTFSTKTFGVENAGTASRVLHLGAGALPFVIAGFGARFSAIANGGTPKDDARQSARPRKQAMRPDICLLRADGSLQQILRARVRTVRPSRYTEVAKSHRRCGAGKF